MVVVPGYAVIRESDLDRVVVLSNLICGQGVRITADSEDWMAIS